MGKLLKTILYGISLFALTPSVLAANLGDTLGQAIKTVYIDIGPLYFRFPAMFDFILYMIFFIFLSQMVMRERFGGKGGALGALMAVMLAIMASVFEYQTGWSLGAFLPPIAGLIIVLAFGFFLYLLIRWATGNSTWGVAVAYILAYVMASGFRSKWSKQFTGPIGSMVDWAFFIGQWVLWWQIISLLIHVVRGMGRGSKGFGELTGGMSNAGRLAGGLFGGIGAGARNTYDHLRRKERGQTKAETVEDVEDIVTDRQELKLEIYETKILEQIIQLLQRCSQNLRELEGLASAPEANRGAIPEIFSQLLTTLQNAFRWWQKAEETNTKIIQDLRVQNARDMDELKRLFRERRLLIEDINVRKQEVRRLQQEYDTGLVKEKERELLQKERELSEINRNITRHNAARGVLAGSIRTERAMENTLRNRINSLFREALALAETHRMDEILHKMPKLISALVVYISKDRFKSEYLVKLTRREEGIDIKEEQLDKIEQALER